MYEPRGSFNDSRFEFEQKLNMLAEKIRKNQMHFSIQSRRSVESIKKVRKLPNGRINLNTVDELVRVTANMMGQFEFDKNDLKYEE